MVELTAASLYDFNITFFKNLILLPVVLIFVLSFNLHRDRSCRYYLGLLESI